MAPDIFKDIEGLIVIVGLLAAVLKWDVIQASLNLGRDRGKMRYF